MRPKMRSSLGRVFRLRAPQAALSETLESLPDIVVECGKYVVSDSSDLMRCSMRKILCESERNMVAQWSDSMNSFLIPI